MRVIGVDLGSKRIGMAISDHSGFLASPHSVIERSDDVHTDHRRIAELVDEVEAERVVVGLPIALSGKKELAARAVEREVAELEEILTVPVELVDERMTTAMASKSLQAAGRSARQQRGVIDSAAAAAILQSWLDTQR